MPREVSRATISSLKATHQAHRIASEILHPHIPTSPPPLHVHPEVWVDPGAVEIEPDPRLRNRFTFTRQSILECILVVGTAAGALLVVYWLQHH